MIPNQRGQTPSRGQIPSRGQRAAKSRVPHVYLSEGNIYPINQTPFYPNQVPIYPNQVPIYPNQVPIYPNQVPIYPNQVPVYPVRPVQPEQTMSRKQNPLLKVLNKKANRGDGNRNPVSGSVIITFLTFLINSLEDKEQYQNLIKCITYISDLVRELNLDEYCACFFSGCCDNKNICKYCNKFKTVAGNKYNTFYFSEFLEYVEELSHKIIFTPEGISYVVTEDVSPIENNGCMEYHPYLLIDPNSIRYHQNNIPQILSEPVINCPQNNNVQTIKKCRFDDKCTNLPLGKCKFYHPEKLPCKYGSSCRFFKKGICRNHHDA